MTINTQRLLDKGITSIQLELDPSGGSASAKATLLKYGISFKDAHPFSISFAGFGYECEKTDIVGIAEGILHRDIQALQIDKTYTNCRQIIYLNTLFVEREYEGCGIASSVLDLMPELVNAEMDAAVDAIVLAPVPLVKNARGEIVQVTDASEFFMKSFYLMRFYSKRGFEMLQPMMMGKILRTDFSHTSGRILGGK